MAGGGLLRNRNFVLLWCAYAISAIGDHLSEMALQASQGALDPQRDITVINARIAFSFFLPFFLFAPLAGLLADRLPRRALMVAADLGRCAIFLCFGTFLYWSRDLGSWAPFLPLIPVGIFATLFSPSRSAMLPTIVEPNRLVRANALISGLGIIGTMVGIKLGGFLADRHEPIVAFRLDAVTYVLSAVCLMLMRPPKSPAAAEQRRPHGGAMHRIREGFSYVRTHRRVWELILISMLIWFCGALVKTTIPAVVRDVYGGSFDMIGTYLAILGGGFVLGAVTMAIIGNTLRGEVAISWGLMGVGIAMLVLAASAFLPRSLYSLSTLKTLGGVGVFFGGYFAVTVMASFNALLQRLVPDRFRGRVFGVKDLAATGSLLVATGALGLPRWSHVDAWVGYILLGVAIVTFGAGVLTLIVRFRRSHLNAAYTAAEHLNEFVCKLVWRFERIGPATVPREGPVIITSNHTSPPDPNFLGVGSPYRPMSFLIAAEYTKWPIFGFISRRLNSIPVKRDGSDAMPLKAAIRRLQSGDALGIFIEGGIGKPGVLRTPKDGVAMMALSTGAAVIPAYISGTKYREGVIAGFLTRHRAKMRYGSPVDLSEFMGQKINRRLVRAASEKIYAAIFALAPDEEPHGTAKRMMAQRVAQVIASQGQDDDTNVGGTDARA